MPTLSVVLPYYKNESTLAACLESFAAQSVPPLEILVVDDGSPVPAEPIVAAYRGAVPVQLFYCERGGQSAATNVGIRAARGDFQLLTCADIVAHPELCATHLEAHAGRPGPTAVLGYLPYHRDVEMTPFMRWINMPARQFCFSLIRDPDRVPAKYCYSPNLSLPSPILRQVDGFDEQFRYGYQDTDLGVRLEQVGVSFVYRAAAIGYHMHPTTVRGYYRRQVMVGEATLRMLRKWPDEAHTKRYASIIQRYRGFLPRLPSLLDDIERLEARIAKLPGLQRRLPNQLVELYDFAMVLGLVEGMLQFPDMCRELLKVEAAATPIAPRPKTPQAATAPPP